jgi:hypothetical protein
MRLFILVIVAAAVIGGFVGGELMGMTFSLTGAVVGGLGLAAVLLGLGAYFHAQEERKKAALTPEILAVFGRMLARQALPSAAPPQTKPISPQRADPVQ